MISLFFITCNKWHHERGNPSLKNCLGHNLAIQFEFLGENATSEQLSEQLQQQQQQEQERRHRCVGAVVETERKGGTAGKRKISATGEVIDHKSNGPPIVSRLIVLGNWRGFILFLLPTAGRVSAATDGMFSSITANPASLLLALTVFGS